MIGAGTPIDGGVVSRTDTICAAEAVLLAASDAVQFTVVVPIGNTEGASLATDATPTASDASASPIETEAPWGDSASASMSGGAAIAGGTVSSTVTSWLAVCSFPAASAAVHTTVVVPVPNRAGASLEMETTPTASDAVAWPWSTCVPAGPAASASTDPGAYRAGGTVSTTDTTCESAAVLPAPSAAVHVTTVLPTGNVSGASLETETGPAASDASGAPRSTTVPPGDSASASTSGGAAIRGGVVSSTVIDCRACAALPAASAAIHVTMVSPIG